MKVAFKKSDLPLDPNKRAYECSGCGNLFHWMSSASWYGSHYDMENNPDKLKYYCKDSCRPKEQS